MRAVVTAVGKDGVGILAKISTQCASVNANVIDVNQTILSDMFCMIMLIEVDHLNKPFIEFVDEMKQYGNDNGLKIHVMHEDIFNSMHKI